MPAQKITKQEWLNRFAQTSYSLVNATPDEIYSKNTYLFVHNPTGITKRLTAGNLWSLFQQAQEQYRTFATQIPQITQPDPLTSENPLQSEATDLTVKLTSNDAELESLRSEKTELIAQLDASYEETDILRSGMTELIAQSDENNKERDILRSQNAELEPLRLQLAEARAAPIQPDPLTSESKVTDLTVKLTSNDAELESLRSDVEKKDELIKYLASEHLSERGQRLALRDQLERLERNSDESKDSTIESLRNDLRKAEEKIATQTSEQADAELQQKLEQETRRLTLERQYRGEEAEDYRNALVKKNEENEGLKEQLRVSQVERSELNQDNMMLRNEREGLKQKIHNQFRD